MRALIESLDLHQRAPNDTIHIQTISKRGIHESNPSTNKRTATTHIHTESEKTKNFPRQGKSPFTETTQLE
jgi:hypothetical protein